MVAPGAGPQAVFSSWVKAARRKHVSREGDASRASRQSWGIRFNRNRGGRGGGRDKKAGETLIGESGKTCFKMQGKNWSGTRKREGKAYNNA